MYTDPIEAKYFEKRLQCSLDMASRAADAGAALAHRGLAACYRAKLRSLLRVQAAPATPMLSLTVLSDKRPPMTFGNSGPVLSAIVSAAGSGSSLAA